MLFVSSRVDLDNEDRLGQADTFWEVDVSDTLETGRTQLPKSEFLSRIQNKRLLILVHGYNNEFEDVVRSYDIIERMINLHMPGFYDQIVGYTWPGGNDTTDWYGPKRRAGVVGSRFSTQLNSIARSARVVDVMSHSLGARVTLKAVERLRAGLVRVSFLMASAVDNESLELGKTHYLGARRAKETVVMYSKHDDVLKYGYTAAEWDWALGYSGPEDSGAIVEHQPETTVVNCKNRIFGHGEYKSSEAVFTFLARWMSGQVGAQFVTL